MWVRDINICFQQHTKNAIFQNGTASVKSNEQSAKHSQLQTVFKMSTVTFFLTKHFNENTILATISHCFDKVKSVSVLRKQY